MWNRCGHLISQCERNKNLPLFLQLKEASNESVGLADAAGDELEPIMFGAGIDQIFGCGESPSPSSISTGVVS